MSQTAPPNPDLSSPAAHGAPPASVAAGLLVEAWRTGRKIADLPARCRPTTAAEAYAIQDETVRLRGTIGGWKVAPGRGGDDPKCSPILASRILPSPAVLSAAEVPEPLVEVEVAVRLGRDLPPRTAPYAPEAVADAIASVHPAFEVLSSRFQDRKSVAALTSLADSQSNGAAVVGPALPEWRHVDLGSVSIGLFCNGRLVGESDGGADSVQILDMLAWLANHAAARCGGLREGQVVITGARIGPLPVEPQSLLEADFLNLGRVSLALTGGV